VKGWNLTPVEILNTAGDEYSPRIEKRGLLYSRSPVTEDENVSLRTELMYSAFRQNGLSEGKIFSKELSSPLHESSACLGPNEDFVIFSRNSPVKRKATNYLYISMSGVHDFQEGVPLPYNDPRFNSAHPSLDRSGKRLLFASDRPGGFGGFDLYYAEYKDGSWSQPINLGEEVNSKNNEIFPSWGEQNLITFSSDRAGGFGGLDLYLLDASQTNWKSVRHLREPFSSEGDDQGLTWSTAEGTGYLSSNRKGGRGGDDIYSFSFSKASPISWLVPEEAVEVLVLLNAAGEVVGRLNDQALWSGTLTNYPKAKGQTHFDMSQRLCGSFVAGENEAPDSIAMKGVRIEISRSDFLQPVHYASIRNPEVERGEVNQQTDSTGGICLSPLLETQSWIVEKQGFAPISVKLDPARPYVELSLVANTPADSFLLKTTIVANRRISYSLEAEVVNAVSMMGVKSGYQLTNGRLSLLSTQTAKSAKAQADKLVDVLRKELLVHPAAHILSSGLSVFTDEGLREQVRSGSTAEASVEVELLFRKVSDEKDIGLNID